MRKKDILLLSAVFLSAIGILLCLPRMMVFAEDYKGEAYYLHRTKMAVVGEPIFLKHETYQIDSYYVTKNLEEFPNLKNEIFENIDSPFRCLKIKDGKIQNAYSFLVVKYQIQNHAEEKRKQGDGNPNICCMNSIRLTDSSYRHFYELIWNNQRHDYKNPGYFYIPLTGDNKRMVESVFLIPDDVRNKKEWIFYISTGEYSDLKYNRKIF